MRRPETQLVDQPGEVVGVLEHAALPSRALAGAVPAPIVGEDPKRLGKRGHHRIPVVMVTPGAVHENERLAEAAQLVVQLDAVDACRRHRNLSDRLRERSLTRRRSLGRDRSSEAITAPSRASATQRPAGAQSSDSSPADTAKTM